MSWDGMYPQHPCKKCGKLLNADGGHPAELYAGTYTGLCYACERLGVYVETVYFDGARRMNHPPHCPSWRRDREHYTSYADCPTCKGKGAIYVSRSFPQGGPYNTQCKECSNRYYNQPIRRAYNEFNQKWRMHFYKKYEKAYQRKLKKELGTTSIKEIESDPDKDKRAKELAEMYIAKYKTACDRIDSFCMRRWPEMYITMEGE